MVWLLFLTAYFTMYHSMTTKSYVRDGWWLVSRGWGCSALPQVPNTGRQSGKPSHAFKHLRLGKGWAQGRVQGVGRPPQGQRRSRRTCTDLCKMQANRYDGSRLTVREQDHLETPPSLLRIKYMYLRGLCENAPRSRAESHLGWAATVVRPYGCFVIPRR